MFRSLSAVLALAASTAFATGFLSVESSPNGAEIWYTGPDDPDRKYLGDTPLENREMPTGRYNLWLILASHDTLAVPEISVHEGQHTLVNREIPTSYGYLAVATSPDSAGIWLDGVMAGTSPLENDLMLPGTRKLKVDPREAHLRNTASTLRIQKGDTILLSILSPYRDKTFQREHLSLTPWRLQLEAGLQQRTRTGIYDTAGKRDKASTDEKRGQTDFPLGFRLGLPQGFEVHMSLPFKTYDDKDTVAAFPSNMTAGLKYTYRPLNVGADITYGLGFEDATDALTHDFLALSVLGAASKGNIVADAQAGFEFHFTDKVNSEMDHGDKAIVHARAGYLVDPFLPYLGLTGVLALSGDLDGKSLDDGGYLVIPEPGVTVEIDDWLGLEVGIPFTILGKGRGVPSFWGIHGSVAVSIDIL